MTTNTLKEYAAKGRTLWISSGKSGQLETIISVGRKWIHTDGETKIDIETGYVDNDYTYDRCYLSFDEFQLEQAKQNAWDDLSKAMRYHSPSPETTLEKIKQARDLLGV